MDRAIVQVHMKQTCTILVLQGLWLGVVTVILCFLFCDFDCKKNEIMIMGCLE